jgi:hypothetical protein
MANATSISTMQNPSLFLYGAGDAKYEERPIPKIENKDDVIVRVSYTGVCGSDVSSFLSTALRLLTIGIYTGAFLGAWGDETSRFD